MLRLIVLSTLLPLLARAAPLPLLGLGDDTGLLGSDTGSSGVDAGLLAGTGLPILGNGVPSTTSLPVLSHNNNGLPVVGNNGPISSTTNNLPLLGSNSEDLLNVAAGITGDVSATINAALGVTIDLTSTTQLLCSLVYGTFSEKQYDLGCTCLDQDGGILLDVDVDVEAIVNVDGLQAWVEAQVSIPNRRLILLSVTELMPGIDSPWRVRSLVSCWSSTDVYEGWRWRR